MKRNLFISGAVVLLVLLFAGCSLLGIPDPIVGTWTQTSVNGSGPALATTFTFTATAYTGSTASITAYSGVWTKSGSVYTLTGTFFGFISTSVTFTPTFSNWNNTLTFTDGNGQVEIYSRQ